MGRWRPTEADLARRRQEFPPQPARTATIDILIEDAVAFVVAMPASKIRALRGLFPDKTDAQIVNELVDELLDRFGV